MFPLLASCNSDAIISANRGRKLRGMQDVVHIEVVTMSSKIASTQSFSDGEYHYEDVRY